MPRKPKINKGGRPREFKEDYVRQARIAFAEGFTDVKFCELIKISRDSFVRWRRDYPDFGDAVQEGKDEFDTDQVEASLKRRAIGFTQNKRYFPPDTAAICFWLKNRRRGRWKDVKAVEASGPDGGPIPIDVKSILKDLSVDELKILKHIAAKAAATGDS